MIFRPHSARFPFYFRYVKRDASVTLKMPDRGLLRQVGDAGSDRESINKPQRDLLLFADQYLNMPRGWSVINPISKRQ